jgi:hypothetical protein
MSQVDGLVGLEAVGWGALIGAGLGIASLVYLLTATPGGWTELVKSLTISLYFSLGAVPYGWVLAWIVGLSHPWLVAVGGAVWFLVAYALIVGFAPERLEPWIHCLLCVLGYGLVAGLAHGGGSDSGSWLAAIVRVAGGVVVLGLVVGLAGRVFERPLERLVVARDLRRLGWPLLVPDVPDHRLHAASVEISPRASLSLHYSADSEDSKVRVQVFRLTEPFPPTEGPWVDVHGPDYWTSDGDDRWIHHTDELLYTVNPDGTRPRLVLTKLAVRHGEILVMFTNEPRLRPMDAKTLARRTETWWL